MPPRFLIIDGYNLMHDAGLARASYGPGDLGRQRLQLLNKLARRLSLEERQRCTVVFDAIDAPPNLSSRFKHESISVVFAKPGQEADEVIEQLVSDHSAPRRVTVISSDHRIQNAINRRKGLAIDSDVFLKQLESPNRNIASPSKSPSASPNTDSDLALWMQEFAGISPDAIDHEIVTQSGEKKTDWESEVEMLQKRMKDPDALEQWLSQPDRDRKPPSSKPPRI